MVSADLLLGFPAPARPPKPDRYILTFNLRRVSSPGQNGADGFEDFFAAGPIALRGVWGQYI